MTATGKKAAKKPFPEARRHTVAVKLRLSEEDARRLRAIAEQEKETVSATVSGYVLADKRRPK